MFKGGLMPAKERGLSVVRGGQYAQLRKAATTAEFQLDREMRDAFVQMHTPEGTVPSEAISDIRRDRQHPWRYLARRIREARQQHVPKDKVKKLARVLDHFIDEVYGDSPRRVA
jgi:hypothetical protein